MSEDMAELGVYKRILGASSAYASRPALTAALANGNASAQDARVVGGFVEALDVERAVGLAGQSGARLNLSSRERSLAGSLGSRYAQVQNNVPFQPLGSSGLNPLPIAKGGLSGQAEDLNWFESAVGALGDAAGNVADFLLTNPVSETLFDGFEWAANGVKAIYRGASSAVNQDNDAEIRRQMERRGYDPNSVTDNISFFWNQGESIYSDVSDLRDEYGDKQVDAMQDFLADGQAYMDNLLGLDDPMEVSRRMQEMERPEWAELREKLDARHISPGRDFADTIGLEHDEAGYTAVSGTLDAVATVLMDPTLLIGSGVRAARVSRDGLDGMMDANGIRRVLGLEDDLPDLATATRRGALAQPLVAGGRSLLSTVSGGRIAGANPVREGTEKFLKDAADYRKAIADGDDELAVTLHAGMTQRHRSLMPLLDEVNGRRVTLKSGDPLAAGTATTATGKGQKVSWDVVDGKAITTVEDFASYLIDTGALLRLSNGLAATKHTLMPGRVSWRAERRARTAERRQDGGKPTDLVFNYDRGRAAALIPDDADRFIQDMADSGQKFNDEFINASRLSLRRHRARAERLNRRLTTYLPKTREIDLSNAGHVSEVRNFARMYLPKREADRVAQLWQSGTLAQRRNITKGLVLSTMNAAGLGRSVDGAKYIAKWSEDVASAEKRRYGFGGADIQSTAAGERSVALYERQLSDSIMMPSFTEMQHLAAKGAFAGRFRGFMQSESLDRAMNIFRMGWLINPATGARNALDEVSGIVASGKGADLFRGRALHTAATADTRAALLAAERTMGKEDRVELRRLTKKVTESKTLEERTAALEAIDGLQMASKFRHRIPTKFRKPGGRINDALFGSVLGKLYGHSRYKGREISDQEVGWAKELVPDEMSDFSQGIVFSGVAAVDESARLSGEVLARQGFFAKPMTYSGHKEVELDGGAGLDSWSHQLGLRFEENSPAAAALRAIADGSPLGKATDDVEAFMRTPAGAKFLRDAEVVNFDMAGKRITDEAARDLAIREYSGRVVQDIGSAVQGRNGQFHEGLLARLLDNDPPDRAWLKDNVKDEFMPAHTIMPQYTPVTESVANRMIEGYGTLLSKAYALTVTKPTNAIVRNPAFTAHYVRARENSQHFVALLKKNGWTDDAAQEHAKAISRQHAELAVAKMIDDPTTRSQMTVVIRNFSNFQRAAEDWGRRWGRNLRDDPTILRKGQLLLEGGTNSGVVDRDAEGNLTFSYPGSGAAITAVNKIFALFGQDHATNIPMADDLSSRLTFVSPSLDNPIGFSASPIVATPFKLFAGMMPEHALAVSGFDKLLNGEMGAGQNDVDEILSGLLPRPITRILNTMKEDPASQLASAQRQAFVQAEAAGLVPDGTDPGELARFQHQLQVMTKNNMIGRALFGFFAPAAPGLPSLDVGGQETDWIFHEQGIDSLKDEARVLIAKLGYQDAMLVWAETHPNELVYVTASATETDAKGAFAPVTLGSAKWLQSNGEFMSQYKGVSSYFIPEAEGDFSSVAFQAQLETGVRSYKDMDDFVEGIVVRRGESEYYDLKDQYDVLIADALESGDEVELAAVKDEWSYVADQLRNFNPLMAAKMGSYGADAAMRPAARNQLRGALGDSTAVNAMGRRNAEAVAMLVALQDRYDQERAAIGGDQSTAARAYGTSLRSETRTAMENVLKQAPQMTDLYNALFRMND